MGRPRNFEVEEVLDTAIDLFRRRGFAATAMQEVVEATSVGRQSLYNTFGDKRDLYVAALDRYLQHESERRESLVRRGAGVEGIRGYFEQRVQMLVAEGAARSCLVASAATELGGLDSCVTERLHRHRRDSERDFAKALRSARRRGELSDRASLPAFAALLVSVDRGMAILARSGASAARLRRSVRDILALIRV